MGKCLTCNKKLQGMLYNRYFCSKRCYYKAFRTPKVYLDKIKRIEKRNVKYKEELNEIIKEKKYNEVGEYVVRKLTTKNKTGDAYGITLPKSVWSKYNRYICRVKSNGVIILIPKEIKWK